MSKSTALAKIIVKPATNNTAMSIFHALEYLKTEADVGGLPEIADILEAALQAALDAHVQVLRNTLAAQMEQGLHSKH